MLCITLLPFAQLRNAEHVAFFNNVVLAIDKVGAEKLGLTAEKFTEFKNTVSAEQDIVLKAQGSMYTADMEGYDKERDRLYRMIRLKLQAVCLASEGTGLHLYKAPLEKYILNKYSTDIVSLPYQEESAHLAGFDLDMHARFTEEDLEEMGVDRDLMALKVANNKFSDMYNERATERSGSTAELTKKLRGDSEELYDHFRLYFEFTADTAGETEKGEACAGIIGVINEVVRDARQHLAQRQGKSDSSSSSEGLDDIVSPIPFPNN